MMIYDIIRVIISQPTPPFPEGHLEADAILHIGVLFALISFLFMFLIAMYVAFKVYKDFSLVLLVWFASIAFGFGLIVQSEQFPFVPSIPIFLIVWQTIIVLLASLDLSRILKEKKRIKNENV